MKYQEVVFNEHGVWFYKFKNHLISSLTPKTYQTKKQIIFSDTETVIFLFLLYSLINQIIETYRSPGFIVQFFVKH